MSSAGRLLLVVAFLTGFWVSGCARADDGRVEEGPLVDRPFHAPRLVVPERLRERLDRGAPEFRIASLEDFHPEVRSFLLGPGYMWNRTQAPSTLLGDFDGDERLDVVVLQCSEDSSRIVAVLDDVFWPSVIEIGRSARGSGEWHGLTSFLTFVPSGDMTWPDFEAGMSDSVVHLEHAAFRISDFEKSATTFVYLHGPLGRYATGD